MPLKGSSFWHWVG